MDEENILANLDSLLLQLALQTRELSQTKDDLTQQIQMYIANIQEWKTSKEESQKSIERLNEEIIQKQNTIKFYTDNTKSLRGTSSLLLQCRKTLEGELERRQNRFNQDMKMYQERIQDYQKVFLRYKEHYCQHPLAKKLVKIQAENEETEQRIRANEEQIIVKEKALNASQGEHDASSHTADASDSLSLEFAESHDQTVLLNEENSQSNISPRQDIQPQNRDNDSIMEEEVAVETQDKTDEQTLMSHQKEAEEAIELEGNVNISGESKVLGQELKGMEAEELEQTTVGINEGENMEGAACFQSSPARMKAALNTPTFSLNSPTNSPACPEGSGTRSPGFVFSVNSDPNTPAFSGFDCGFDIGSAQGEDPPFTFTSSYFSDEKSPGPKFSGFPFDQAECQPEEEFHFSFSSKSPQPPSAEQGKGGSSDDFPFSFNFGKF